MNKYLFFTATNTTWRVMKALGADAGNSLNLTAGTPAEADLGFSEQDFLYIGFPVYGGRVPQTVLHRLESLKGNGCKTAIVAVYGNRHYDDALKEMQAFAEQHGCKVVAAIAAVAEHSIVPSIATGRPDATDTARLQAVKQEIEQRAAAESLEVFPPRPAENYREFNGVPVHPMGTDNCTGCGLCAEECPMQAISHESPKETDGSRCITCMRCVAVCPTGSRQLPEAFLVAMTERLMKLCPERRETEVLWNID